MSAMCVRALLLYTVVVDVSARVVTTKSPADQTVLSPRHYQHTDPISGLQLICDKCPAGTYVSSHCSSTAVRECSPCPEGTFTRGENGVQQCHHCRAPCPLGFIEKASCTAIQDRVCTCPPNSFLLVDGTECKPHSMCPAGTRVKKRGSATADAICKPCNKGTFSGVSSTAVKCRTHTDCQAQGLVLLTPGTRETDNVCGSSATTPPSSSASSSTSPNIKLGPAQKAIVQEAQTYSSSPLLSLNGPAHKGIYSQSAAIQLRDSQVGENHHADGLHLSLPDTPIPPIHDPPRTQLSPAHRLPMDSAQQRGQPNSDAVPGPNRQGMDGLVSSEVVRVGTSVSKVAEQGSGGGGGGVSTYYRPTRRGSPRPSSQNHFDINEHLPWMIVLLLLLVLIVIVVCSVKRSSRVLKKGPVQDPCSIMEKAIQKKPSAPPAQIKERWIYYSNGQGVDILKLVAAHVGTHWIDIYQSLANATEREVAAFSNGYSSDHERAYAALQHWTIRDSDANLAKLINALHRQRRIDVVEKIRCVMEDNPQFDINQLMTSVNVSQSLSPAHKVPGSPASNSSHGSSGGGSVGASSGVGVEQSPVDRSKGFFPDESEPLLRCDSTSSKDSGLSRNGSFITKEKKDTVLRQVRLDPCDLQPIFDDMLHILNPEELHVIEEIPDAEDKLDRLFEIAGVKSQEASQTLLDSVYSHLPDLL
ncbi:tumor necrosis factor receptor superfamily member 21 [Solea senegalensis]|uniref:Tumor necrosis factor receptor superfamily member 21 n=1 Tax=Solea senegalensis TaxID=28829 RepID=A0AAV6RS60_SOLSE|nr:tumor necrosis factor receptor superfamily member 21 isoform X2 [Solea senegalensis]KAG7508271.1 tumor necrosis factor receptor superfamily member 21 [Solea senegalensis]